MAAEDANFCLHWGFDMSAIRDAIADGAARGGSTISQQTVKNAFLWHGRSWVRKALEAAITPVMELIWPKRRVLEVYLNVAEFAPGVFGAEAAAQHHFGVSAADLTERQAVPSGRCPSQPAGAQCQRPQSDFVNRRARVDCKRGGNDPRRWPGRLLCELIFPDPNAQRTATQTRAAA